MNGQFSNFWENGWYQPARCINSPNFGVRPQQQQPELIVIHSISLPPGEFENGHIQQLFMNELDWSAHPYFEKIRGMEVSSHFVIDRHGRLTQYVSCDSRAWHAGRSSWHGRKECNDWSIGIELEGLEGQNFEHHQYETLIRLVDDICAQYPIQWVAGHEHIAPGRKIDPGSGFNWGKLISNTKRLLPSAFPPEVFTK